MRPNAYELAAMQGGSQPIGDQAPMNTDCAPTLGLRLVALFSIPCPPRGSIAGDPMPRRNSDVVNTGGDDQVAFP